LAVLIDHIESKLAHRTGRGVRTVQHLDLAERPSSARCWSPWPLSVSRLVGRSHPQHNRWHGLNLRESTHQQFLRWCVQPKRNSRSLEHCPITHQRFQLQHGL